MINFLKKEILTKQEKMISYREFIDLVLYHPQWGYYMKSIEKVGRKGDFITTSNISDIYGRTIAKWFLRIKQKYNLKPAVCEIGAGNGRFAAAFIDEWRKLSDEPLQYLIVEESPFHRELQKEIIPFDERIKQLDKLEEVRLFNGLIFSNELFDALPVHVIEMRKGQLMEVMVTIEEERLAEKLVPLQNEKVWQFIKKSSLSLKENQRIEIPLLMEEVVSSISDVIERGLVLTVDYGYTDEEWMEPVHRQGSLRGYYKHEQLNNVLRNPGEMDITSHVHFDSFIKVGEEKGLHFVKKLRQDEFLLAIGILEELQDHQDPNPFSSVSRRNRAIRSLIIPSGMSSYFHVILQQKGLEQEVITDSFKGMEMGSNGAGFKGK